MHVLETGFASVMDAMRFVTSDHDATLKKKQPQIKKLQISLRNGFFM